MSQTSATNWFQDDNFSTKIRLTDFRTRDLDQSENCWRLVFTICEAHISWEGLRPWGLAPTGHLKVSIIRFVISIIWFIIRILTFEKYNMLYNKHNLCYKKYNTVQICIIWIIISIIYLLLSIIVRKKYNMQPICKVISGPRFKFRFPHLWNSRLSPKRTCLLSADILGGFRTLPERF